MRITTWNVNGLRAAIKKGFMQHLDVICPDILLLQEIRCHPEQLPKEFQDPEGWCVHWHPAQRPGYSGTAIWSRTPVDDVVRGIEGNADEEGRVIAGSVKGVRLASIYLPSGSSGDARQKIKEDWLGFFGEWGEAQVDSAPLILGGDFNIAHTERDIFHAKSNQKTSGFLPHERQWFSDFLDCGWDDLVRRHFGNVNGPYSWWSNRGKARELDRGWRIDYLLANRNASTMFRSASIHRDGGLEVSDHAPVTIEIDETMLRRD
ncbi:MAG: exodeoxyribonuclease III [Planctomycetaceae bacterium]|nr:exodeoxyribonuclease III [Planctomycetaceae bacterium]